MNNIITLVGRPNVGKSTIFNKLTKTNNAIVADVPGYTRDCQQGTCKFENKTFFIVDTAGLFFNDDEVSNISEANTLEAITESDLLMFVVDGEEGLVSSDIEIANNLRKLHKKIYLVVNKIDKVQKDIVLSEFSELGFDDVTLISGKNGSGIKEISGKIVANIEEDIGSDIDEDLNLAILGKPNVGKSTLVNSFLGKDKQITQNKPGTTRDCIKIPVTKYGYKFNIVDTPGVRRKSKTKNHIEIIGVIKTLKTIEASDVVIILIDSLDGITDQDLSLIGTVMELGKPALIALNKTDAADEYQEHLLTYGVDTKLKFINYIPIHKISALKGIGLKKLLSAAMKIYDNSRLSINTSILNDIMQKAIFDHQPPAYGGKRIKIRYVHQGGNNPIRLIIHGTYVDKLSKDYLRYLSSYIRKKIELTGITIFFELRNKFEK
ncbi:MAG: ribosome biogenesis GTPase Der [Gammaproteobacteria bacterium]|jgi:GTPase|nr:ribosome biogenesis GTPase Der [Gammaproteobacteria bacterium]MBT6754524.1 ribosome biogenesis GTPase Der [Gammaproteobacteria bacterium]MBT7523677.1 ribosome biogenesis GTPase Der [Gammaproteobacteria bacterium]MBT7814563.1 ribosome biogenesis GTPase Der [Gammaproteobacteria bacterium]